MLFRSRNDQFHRNVRDNVRDLVVFVQVLQQDHNNQDHKVIDQVLVIAKDKVAEVVVDLIIAKAHQEVLADLIADQVKVVADNVQVLVAVDQVQVDAEIHPAHLEKVAARRARNVNLKKRYVMTLKICKRQLLAAWLFRAEMAKQ